MINLTFGLFTHMSDSGPQGSLDYILKLNLSNSCLKALTSPSIKFSFFYIIIKY